MNPNDQSVLRGLNMIRKLQFATGITLAIAAAAIMFEGSLLGENTAGIAIVMLIVGIGLIANSKFRLLK